MRLIRVSIALLGAIALPALGVVTSASLTTCGLSCLHQTIPESGCSPSNSSCLCSNMVLAQLTAACLEANCTMHDSLLVSKVTAAQCNYPHQDRSGVLISVTVTVLAITSPFIVLRLASKGQAASTIGTEDVFIVVALVLSFVSSYFTITYVKRGFGKHLWDLNDGDLTVILQKFYIGENLYVIILALSKLSILFFYLRIFPHPQFRKAVFTVIGVITATTTVIFFLTVFSCHPIPYFWDKDLHGLCINLNALAYANSGLSIGQDLIITALPLPTVVNLHLSTRRKIDVSIIFALGGFGCIVSMIRLKSLLSFGTSIDPTWDYVDAVIWTDIELAVAMICACLPAIRNLLVQLFPSAFQPRVRSSAKQPTPSSSGSHSWNSRRSARVDLGKDAIPLATRDGDITALEYDPHPSALSPRDGTAESPDIGQRNESPSEMWEEPSNDDEWHAGVPQRLHTPRSGV